MSLFLQKSFSVDVQLGSKYALFIYAIFSQFLFKKSQIFMFLANNQKSFLPVCSDKSQSKPSQCVTVYTTTATSKKISNVWWNFKEDCKILWPKQVLCKFQKQPPKVPQACNFTKKETLAQLFSHEFCEIFKNTFFIEHLRTTASEISTKVIMVVSSNVIFR